MKLKEFGICYINSLIKNIACYVIKKLALEIILMSLNTELIKLLMLTFFAILQENEMLSVLYIYIIFVYIPV